MSITTQLTRSTRRIFSRLIFQIMLSVFFILTSQISEAETRCGWFDINNSSGNPPQSALFTDNISHWKVDRTAGEWPNFRFSDMHRPYGPPLDYGPPHLTCVCMDAEVSYEDRTITKMRNARVIPLDRCKQDKAIIWQP